MHLKFSSEQLLVFENRKGYNTYTAVPVREHPFYTQIKEAISVMWFKSVQNGFDMRILSCDV